MDAPNIRSLIKAGFHFGHRTSRWNPKMAPYIFKQRNLIHITDLRATVRGLITGRMLARAVAARGRYVMFVDTKKQAAEPIAREAGACGMPYVCERWLGGLLTNYATIRTRLERLVELEELEQTGQINLHSKKMVSSLRREKRKILRNLGGVRGMDELPGLLVMVDPARENIAVKEAHKLGIPIVALTDTDGSPDDVDIVVPGNDDSFGAIDIFLSTMAEGVRQGLKDGGVVRGIVTPETAPQPAAAASVWSTGLLDSVRHRSSEGYERSQTAPPVSFAFDAGRFGVTDIVEILGLMSDIYRSLGGDGLEVVVVGRDGAEVELSGPVDPANEPASARHVNGA